LKYRNGLTGLRGRGIRARYHRPPNDQCITSDNTRLGDQSKGGLVSLGKEGP
jgi:hypothetical protein